jgi:hypothetical protein
MAVDRAVALKAVHWLLLAAVLVTPAEGAAQTDAPPGPGRATPGQTIGGTELPGWLFPPRRLLPDLLAGPRDPVVKAQVGYADPDPTAYGAGTSGEVALAGTVPLVRLAGRDRSDALVLGVEAAAFARFSFEVVTRELVNTDWVFAVPLVWHRQATWLRLRYYHTSSHLGDEYQRRFGPSSINFFRDGVDLTAYTRPGPARALGAGVYGMAFWAFNADPETATFWGGRAGIEVDPGDRRTWGPYAALDLELSERLAGPRWTAQLGLWLPGPTERPLRLALELVEGPAPMGQFYRRDTRRVGLSLLWNP